MYCSNNLYRFAPARSPREIDNFDTRNHPHLELRYPRSHFSSVGMKYAVFFR
jgi:hypothetical protein